MQRTYEIMFIVRPDILDEDLDKLIAGLEANITQGGGSIKSMEKLGRRKLAYTVKKFNDGNYVLTPMRKAQLTILDEVLDRTAKAVEMVLAKGAGPAMNEFNRRENGGEQERIGE